METSTIRGRPLRGWPVARYWVLKGQPQAARPKLVLLVPGSDPRRTSPTLVGLVGLVRGSGFGGVFVNWIVDASI